MVCACEGDLRGGIKIGNWTVSTSSASCALLTAVESGFFAREIPFSVRSVVAEEEQKGMDQEPAD